jgi:hypothetical protein
MPIFVPSRAPHVLRGAWLGLILAASDALLPQVSAAHTTNPFVEFLGTWRGSGHIVESDGRSERISCRATYSGSESGEALAQSLVSASDSYRFDVHSYVVADNRDVEGYWEESTRKVTGHLIGQVEGGQFEGSIAGASVAAKLSLKTTGRKQAASSRPRGGDIVKVEIVLSRENRLRVGSRPRTVRPSRRRPPLLATHPSPSSSASCCC